MQATPECWKCLFTSEADQREKITASASHSCPCQTSSASLTLCRAPGLAFLALHLSTQQRLCCHKCSLGREIAPLKPTRTSHRPWGKQASGLESQWQALKSLQEGCPADSRTGSWGRHSKSQHWRDLSPGWDMRGLWGPIIETYSVIFQHGAIRRVLPAITHRSLSL